MLKVRLHGESGEMKQFILLLKKLEQQEEIKIISESKSYKDRGKSDLSRIYIDLNLKNHD